MEYIFTGTVACFLSGFPLSWLEYHIIWTAVTPFYYYTEIAGCFWCVFKCAKTEPRFSSISPGLLAYFFTSFQLLRGCTYPLYGAQTIKVTKKKRSNRLLCFTKTTDDKKIQQWNRFDINALMNVLWKLSGITKSAIRFKSLERKNYQDYSRDTLCLDTCLRNHLKDAGHEFKSKGYDLIIFPWRTPTVKK